MHVFALLGALAALIAILAALRAIWRWRRVRRFRKRILRLKRLLSRGKPDPSIVMQRLSDLMKEIKQAYAKGKIAEEDYKALNELANI
jgi:hypothetical protein